MFRIINTAMTALVVYSTTSAAAYAQSASEGGFFSWLSSSWSRLGRGSGPEMDAETGTAMAQSASEGRFQNMLSWLSSNWSGHQSGTQYAASSTRRAVPEIDAANGLLALAAVGAALALAYEINRRRKG